MSFIYIFFSSDFFHYVLFNARILLFFNFSDSFSLRATNLLYFLFVLNFYVGVRERSVAAVDDFVTSVRKRVRYITLCEPEG